MEILTIFDPSSSDFSVSYDLNLLPGYGTYPEMPSHGTAIISPSSELWGDLYTRYNEAHRDGLTDYPPWHNYRPFWHNHQSFLRVKPSRGLYQKLAKCLLITAIICPICNHWEANGVNPAAGFCCSICQRLVCGNCIGISQCTVCILKHPQ